MGAVMQNLILGRRTYWALVAALVVLKVAVVVVVISAPQTISFLRHVDTAIIIGLALVVGGRFADIGWPRWLGIILVFVLTFVVPIVLLFLSPPTSSSNLLDVVPDLAWIGTVTLAALLIMAGIKNSASGPDNGTGGKDAGHDGRKEPRFS
jgi:hypothetical protein